jgi:hypothetical protein
LPEFLSYFSGDKCSEIKSDLHEEQGQGKCVRKFRLKIGIPEFCTDGIGKETNSYPIVRTQERCNYLLSKL